MKKSRSAPLGAALLAGALLLSGCAGTSQAGETGGDPVPGGVLVYGTDVQPAAGGLDPYVTVAFANQNVMVQIYETLLTKSDDGEIEPGLAESWEQVDDTHVRVTLREGVQFSDGTPLTVEDVVYSFEHMIAPGAAQAQYLTGLETVTAVDDRTVEFAFAAPNGAFLNVISARGTSYIVNAEWYESTSPEDRQRSALGTGPFALESWEDNVAVTLVRNENYWEEGLPYLDGVEFRILPDETARQSALRQGGDVDAVWLRDATLASQLEGEGFTVGSNAATRGINLYVNGEEGPLSDVRVRQAISLAMDREEIIALGAGGEGEPSLIVPSGDPAGVVPDVDTPMYTRDVDAAVELLEEAGYPDGVTVTLNYASDASFAIDVPAYEVMKEQLAEAGITLDLRGSAWSDVVSSFGTSSWTDLVAIPGIYAPDVTSYIATVISPGSPMNRVATADSPGVAELAELFTTTDPEARADVLAGLQDIVAENAYMYVLYAQPQRYEVWSSRLQGYDVDPYTYRWKLKQAWLAQ